MDLLKLAFTSLPTLVSLNYYEKASEIILTVDASLEGWRKVLMQLVEGKKYSSRYKSEIWFCTEKKYDTTKWKYCSILKALKKVRYWLYGIRFILKTDANILVVQLNWSNTNLELWSFNG